ncbi:uncharacterized protein [Typha angustifolia]|uniref:uncharacterized protein isoform X2 n=1 Tax=Typha angustifolia TaxID=59011 RepID=UPI003C2CF77E
MEGINMKGNKQSENEEEYVLLDLDDIYVSADIPANAPYVLSGLSTMNPTLVIGDQLKLIGEYQETIGTCYVFSESDGAPAVMNTETEPSDKNLPKEKCTVDPNQAPTKKVKPVAHLHKVLKFKDLETMFIPINIQKNTMSYNNLKRTIPLR